MHPTFRTLFILSFLLLMEAHSAFGMLARLSRVLLRQSPTSAASATHTSKLKALATHEKRLNAFLEARGLTVETTELSLRRRRHTLWGTEKDGFRIQKGRVDVQPGGASSQDAPPSYQVGDIRIPPKDQEQRLGTALQTFAAIHAYQLGFRTKAPADTYSHIGKSAAKQYQGDILEMLEALSSKLEP